MCKHAVNKTNTKRKCSNEMLLYPLHSSLIKDEIWPVLHMEKKFSARRAQKKTRARPASERMRTRPGSSGVW